MSIYVITAAATLLTGYALGRWRPWQQVREWAWGTVLFPAPGRALKARTLLALLIHADRYIKARLNPPKPRPRRPAPKLRIDRSEP